MRANLSPPFWLLLLALGLGGCTAAGSKDKAKKKAEPKRAQRKLAPVGGDAVIDGCLAEFPKTGKLGGGIDDQRAWKICMVQSGQQTGLCDTSNMIGLATAVCIARGKGLAMASQWRVRLEFSPAPVPRVLWRLAQLDESAHTLIDVHSGETVASRKAAKDLHEPVLLDAEPEAAAAH